MLFKVREYRLKLVSTLLRPCRSTTKRVEVEQTDRQTDRQTDTHTRTTTVTLRRMRRGLITINGKAVKQLFIQCSAGQLSRRSREWAAGNVSI